MIFHQRFWVFFFYLILIMEREEIILLCLLERIKIYLQATAPGTLPFSILKHLFIFIYFLIFCMSYRMVPSV
jgi:hypothetical protein